MRGTDLTIVCATLNARDAVRLTFASLARTLTTPVAAVLVADNGSTDGTLGDMQALDLPSLRVWSLPERQALADAEAAARRARLGALAATVAAMPPHQRRLFDPARPGIDPDGRVSAQHGATLDWLLARVTTPWLLTLDSDVEFLQAGWLDDLVRLAEADDLVAIGEYEAGDRQVQARLAPYVLLVQTAAVRAAGASFRSRIEVADPVEAARWVARPDSLNVDPAELAGYSSARFWATGAALFARLRQRGARWAPMPATMACRYRHLGHLSWAGDDAGAGDHLRQAHTAALADVRRRLRDYGLAPSPTVGREAGGVTGWGRRG